MSYRGTSARSKHSCADQGHLWAYFGEGTVQAMSQKPTPHVHLMCVFCHRERYIRDCEPIFSEREESRGRVSRHQLASAIVKDRPPPELPPDEGPVRL